MCDKMEVLDLVIIVLGVLLKVLAVVFYAVGYSTIETSEYCTEIKRCTRTKKEHIWWIEVFFL